QPPSCRGGTYVHPSRLRRGSELRPVPHARSAHVPRHRGGTGDHRPTRGRAILGEGWALGGQMTSIAPWLSLRSATEALAFYHAAFGAVERERLEDERGEVVVAQLSVDGAAFWVQNDP